MSDIVPGIHRLKVPMPRSDVLLGYSNAYLVKGNDGYTMIDAGWNTGKAYDAVVKQMNELGIAVTRIRQILVTHNHPDHFGLAGKLKKVSGATVYMHYLDKESSDERYIDRDSFLNRMTDWFKMHGVPPALIRVMHRVSAAMVEDTDHVQPDIELKGQETVSTGLFDLKIIWTPGHSHGEICFYEPLLKYLFSGDHILPHASTYIGLSPQSQTKNPLGDYIDSLKKIQEMDITLMLPGHENPFTHVKSRIAGIIRHHEKRNTDILHQLKSGLQTAYRVAAGVPWNINIGGIDFERLSLFDKRLAILETLAHLELLKERGNVTQFNENETAFYQLS